MEQRYREALMQLSIQLSVLLTDMGTTARHLICQIIVVDLFAVAMPCLVDRLLREILIKPEERLRILEEILGTLWEVCKVM
jgi:hypothetical protein